jgi:integrase
VKTHLTATLLDQLRPGLEPTDVGADGAIRATRPLSKNARDYIVRDTETRGLAVRVSGAGDHFTRSFIVSAKMGGSATRKRVLGHYDPAGKDLHLTLQQARARAESWRGKMRDRIDPLHEKRKRQELTEAQWQAARQTFGWSYSTWCALTESQRSPRTQADRTLVCGWLKGTAMWQIPFRELDTASIDAELRPLFAAAMPPRLAKDGRPLPRPEKPKWAPRRLSLASAWKTFNYARAAWNAGSRVAKISDKNPFSEWMRQIEPPWPKVAARERALEVDEAPGAQWIKHLVKMRDDANPTLACCADYLLCALLWGGRRLETARLTWADVDWQANLVMFRLETRKVPRRHVFPLAPWAREILIERRAKNAARGLHTDDSAWVFPSRRRSSAQVADENENAEPVMAANVTPPSNRRTTHIQSIAEALAVLEQASGHRITPHDLRRTVANEIFGNTRDTRVVGLVLGHSSAENITAGYIRERIKPFRSLYEKRERKLRLVAGIGEKEKAELTQGQRAILDSARVMLQNVGLEPSALVEN